MGVLLRFLVVLGFLWETELSAGNLDGITAMSEAIDNFRSRSAAQIILRSKIVTNGTIQIMTKSWFMNRIRILFIPTRQGGIILLGRKIRRQKYRNRVHFVLHLSANLFFCLLLEPLPWEEFPCKKALRKFRSGHEPSY